MSTISLPAMCQQGHVFVVSFCILKKKKGKKETTKMKPLMQNVYSLQNLGRFPFSRKLKLRKFWQEFKWNGPFRLGATGMFGTTSEGDLF